MAKSKTAIIREYLEKNPDATGKEAAAALKKYGISAQYFYTIKSSTANRQARAAGKAPKKVVRRKIQRGSSELSVDELQTVAKFAGEFGGLNKLTSAITALRQIQLAGE